MILWFANEDSWFSSSCEFVLKLVTVHYVAFVLCQLNSELCIKYSLCMKYCFIIVRSLQREENRHFCDFRVHIKLMDLQCILFLPIFVPNLAFLISQSWQPCIMHITVYAVRIAAWTQTYLLTLWSAFCDLMKQFHENFRGIFRETLSFVCRVEFSIDCFRRPVTLVLEAALTVYMCAGFY